MTPAYHPGTRQEPSRFGCYPDLNHAPEGMEHHTSWHLGICGLLPNNGLNSRMASGYGQEDHPTVSFPRRRGAIEIIFGEIGAGEG